MPFRHLRTFLLALLLPAGSALLAAEDDNDPRQTFQAGVSPDWLRAVGRLTVPGIRYEEGRRRHHTERCSATLVRGASDRAADTIVTAWHCVEYYEDLSQRILFQVVDADDQPVEIEARQVADGGDIDADWAILKLQRPVPRGEAPALEVGAVADKEPLLMAGYSRDTGLGKGGTRLTYDPQCRVTGGEPGSGYTDSDCKAYKGASGGAVIQLSRDGTPSLAGVISQGDGDGLSRYIPVGIFRSALLPHL
ncbi:S1 family peptidase [Parahaliea maris]|uniref:S1 family peptidase n=1 Tax=Parahaliea maris TaxID=2716870 RepID=A0A5C9A729_9GAMM|nr:trypsin-like peptidase domain-containing protein [Parahaliea maris]TXS95470.1 S1 family peptidase [Parahaliea maris]